MRWIALGFVAVLVLGCQAPKEPDTSVPGTKVSALAKIPDDPLSKSTYDYVCGSREIPWIPDFVAGSEKYAERYDMVRSALWTDDPRLGSRCRKRGLLFLAGAEPKYALDDLIEFAEQRYSTVLSPDLARVTILAGNAVQTTGWLIRSGGLDTSERLRAFDYLTDSTKDANWLARKPSWSQTDKYSQEEMLYSVMLHSLAGLAAAGTPEALELLSKLADDPSYATRFDSLQAFRDGFTRASTTY